MFSPSKESKTLSLVIIVDCSFREIVNLNVYIYLLQNMPTILTNK